MKSYDYRIFLSYRGESEGLDSAGLVFANELYKYYHNDPFYYERYGRIYLSTETDKTGNFIKSIPFVMKNVKYFIMPLTQKYFADFWNEENNCPNRSSVTYLEITEAIKNKAEFICVAFPEFIMDNEVIKKLFGNDAEIISGAKLLRYTGDNKEEIFVEICDETLKKDVSFNGIGDIIGNTIPNVFLSFKSETEDKIKYPFYQKLFDIKSITLLNYASSTFISGIDIAMVYKENDSLKRWFSYHLAKGDIIANIILTNPISSAAKDAADYKMYPDNRTIPSEQIILHNMNKLFEFMKENPQAKLNVYLTNIALPYGIMMTEHRNPDNNHIKIDLYAPVIDSDSKRPSFYLLQNDERTSLLYDFFKGNIQNIMNNYAYPFDGHPDIAWMKNKHTHIIHRGMLKKGSRPHTQKSIYECINTQLPIEVDLLPIIDGTETVLVGRSDELFSYNGKTISLADCSASDIRKINRNQNEDRIITLNELLNMVSGKIPVLLEIKSNKTPLDKETNQFIETIINTVSDYLMRCSSFFSNQTRSYSHGIAIHSSNPYVLKRIKEINCMIPCGIISTDFSKIAPDANPDFIELHRNKRFLEIITPDFISYDVRYLNNGIANQIKKDFNIPLLVWTVRNEEDQLDAEDYKCDNIIIEGAKDYLL